MGAKQRFMTWFLDILRGDKLWIEKIEMLTA